ncbi:MAG TPA: DUF3108 domain-containing protein [Rhizomicrobium sp.]|nr:DUF3108 domain-containing protein [Rhizomicrobium sp.]
MTRTSNRLIRTALAIGALAFSAAGTAAERVSTLTPSKSGGMDVDYTIAFWTLPFGHTSFALRFNNSAYRIESHFETSGIISALWDSHIDASASGQIGARGIAPATYDSMYRRGNTHHQRVRVTFPAGAVPVTYADPPYNTKKYPVSDEEKKQGYDPLSAATSFLAGLRATAGNPCGTAAPVFDGRRRYNIEFTYVRDEQVKLESGLYSGKAHLCQLHYNQIAGFKPKILKEGRALPPAYAWVAEIPSASAPLGYYLLPLKAWTSTGFGTVTATLTAMNLDGAAKG